jgi:photosystem II stability/assembly factor-like uncharacterized protein
MDMRVATLAAAAVLTASMAVPQTAPARLKTSCSPEMVQALALPCSTDEPCPLFLELAAAEVAGPRLVLTGNLHTGSTTLESVLLSSDDGGRTWTEVHPRLPSVVLDQIQFIDFETGWTNGHVLSGVPRDPFFLLTTDGGKTWRRRPIYDEARTGVVDRFWFESRTSGTLALDRVRAAETGLRYEIWESMTGGESWSVRQVDSNPLSIKRPVREPLLRIRTEGSVHRIERRDGDRWSAIATFDVSAGECKPPGPAEAEQAPPPAEPEPAQPPAGPRKPPTLRKK